MRNIVRTISVCFSIGVLAAQLTPEQRALDFQNLTALYAKRYAPYSWKQQAFGFDLFNAKPWLDRVRAAKDDLEFYEIEAEYVASLQDTHSAFNMPSSFVASLGLSVDIYDGKVLIESVNRIALPIARFPFTVGDELVSVDGKSAEDLITLFSKWRKYGNPATTRRAAAAAITVRSQRAVPRAVELGDSAEVVIRRAGGTEETYTLPWTKTGVPLVHVGPVPSPKASVMRAAGETAAPSLQPLDELRNWKLPDGDVITQNLGWSDDPDGEPRKFVSGQGSRTPIFRAGLPSSFVQRLGIAAADFHFSGTYRAGGLTIGYLRIPGFAPTNQANAVKELDTEIDYMQKNTDGLVVDVMRNNGGGCFMLDAAARLIPYPFYFFGEQIRATQDRLNSFQSALEFYRATRGPDWVIATYQSFVDQMKEALAANRGMTDSIAACTQFGSDWAPVRDNNPPASIVYTKPFIVLVDEFSISAADIFPAMIQDNLRAPLVGMRTSGGGGSVSGWQTGYYSESGTANTNTLVVRKNPIVTPDLPTAPYVENIGARPDIQLDYMTRDNLMTGGRPFVEAFTNILIDQIQKAKPAQ